MKKISKSNRNKIYRKALELMESGNSQFMCDNLLDAFDQLNFSMEIPRDSNNNLEFPQLIEFHEMKPKKYVDDCLSLWFPRADEKSRKKVFKKCIKMTDQ